MNKKEIAGLLLVKALQRELTTDISMVADKTTWEDCLLYCPITKRWYLYYNVHSGTTHAVHLTTSDINSMYYDQV